MNGYTFLSEGLQILHSYSFGMREFVPLCVWCEAVRWIDVDTVIYRWYWCQVLCCVKTGLNVCIYSALLTVKKVPNNGLHHPYHIFFYLECLFLKAMSFNGKGEVTHSVMVVN